MLMDAAVSVLAVGAEPGAVVGAGEGVAAADDANLLRTTVSPLARFKDDRATADASAGICSSREAHMEVVDCIVRILRKFVFRTLMNELGFVLMLFWFGLRAGNWRSVVQQCMKANCMLWTNRACTDLGGKPARSSW